MEVEPGENPNFGPEATIDEDAQGGGFDEAQESDNDSPAPPVFDDSQVRPGRGKGEEEKARSNVGAGFLAL